MPNQEHANLLDKGVEVWNRWRKDNFEVRPDLSGVICRLRNLQGINFSNTDLSGACLEGCEFGNADFTRANLSGAKLCACWENGAELSSYSLKGNDIQLGNYILKFTKLDGANCNGATFSDADISGASLMYAHFDDCNLHNVNFTWANLEGSSFTTSDLSGADFSGAFLTKAQFGKGTLKNATFKGTLLKETDISNADLSGAILTGAMLIEANVQGVTLDDCVVYGISVWNLKGIPSSMTKLVITEEHEPMVTVDDLDVAQFIYLLLKREKLRNVLDTITSKAVLILGRFSTERKKVLDAIADELRKTDFLPIIFDFERAKRRDFTETIKWLAGMCRFVIVDITNPSSTPMELQATVPDYKIPFVPIIAAGEIPFAMFSDLRAYPWIIPLQSYSSIERLLAGFKEKIIDAALKKDEEMTNVKSAPLTIKEI